MDVGKLSERLMGMSEETWARHANPWSGWTRVSVLPLMAIAVWSRAWIGWWALAPVALIVLWTWLNPRLFASPRSTDNWMSKGVLGERVWLNRKRVAIPARHGRMAVILNSVSAVGAAAYAWGLWRLELWPVLGGMATAMLAKLWFIDRMVWLYETMARDHAEYRAWLR